MHPLPYLLLLLLAGNCMAKAAPFLAAMCQCFGSEVGHAANLEDRLKKLSDQVDELESLRKDVQKVVDDAPKADREPTEVARGWLKRADSIIHRAGSVMEKAERKKKRYNEQEGSGEGCCAHSWSRYKLGRRIAKVSKEALRHKGKGKELKILHDEGTKPAADKEKATHAGAAKPEHDARREEKAAAAAAT